MSKGPYNALKSLPGLVTPRRPPQTLLATLRGLLHTSHRLSPARKFQGDTVFALYLAICALTALYVIERIRDEVKR